MDGLIPSRSLTVLYIPKFPMASVFTTTTKLNASLFGFHVASLVPGSPCFPLVHLDSYDTAALAGGYSIDDPAEFASRVTALMGGNLGVSAAAAPEEPSDEPPTEEVAAEIVE